MDANSYLNANFFVPPPECLNNDGRWNMLSNIFSLMNGPGKVTVMKRLGSFTLYDAVTPTELDRAKWTLLFPKIKGERVTKDFGHGVLRKSLILGPFTFDLGDQAITDKEAEEITKQENEVVFWAKQEEEIKRAQEEEEAKILAIKEEVRLRLEEEEALRERLLEKARRKAEKEARRLEWEAKRLSEEAEREAEAKRLSEEADREAEAKRLLEKTEREAEAKRLSEKAEREAEAKRLSEEAEREAKRLSEKAERDAKRLKEEDSRRKAEKKAEKERKEAEEKARLLQEEEMIAAALEEARLAREKSEEMAKIEAEAAAMKKKEEKEAGLALKRAAIERAVEKARRDLEESEMAGLENFDLGSVDEVFFTSLSLGKVVKALHRMSGRYEASDDLLREDELQRFLLLLGVSIELSPDSLPFRISSAVFLKMVDSIVAILSSENFVGLLGNQTYVRLGNTGISSVPQLLTMLEVGGGEGSFASVKALAQAKLRDGIKADIFLETVATTIHRLSLVAQGPF